MNIDRKDFKIETSARERVKFCLDQLEKAEEFNYRRGVTWSLNIVPRLTVEEIIGALVSVEQELMDGGD